MLTLAADTSTETITVALCDGETVLAEASVRADRKHSERLLETVQWVFQESGKSLNEVELLAISAGPGSFTGLRVGVATWKGLAMGSTLPLVAVPTLDAMTRLGVFIDATVCPLLDAKMAEVFGAVYRFDGAKRHKLFHDFVGPVGTILDKVNDDTIFLGAGSEVYRAEIIARVARPVFASGACATLRASAVAAEALERVQAGDATDPALVRPVYLRKSQAEEARDAAKEAPLPV